MEIVKPAFKRYLFICEHARDTGACCDKAGAQIRESLKNAVKAKGLDRVLRVSRSGCLDACAEGPNVLMEPEHVWFKSVTEADVEEILKRASEGLCG
jgi:(2Fe-2S) ferredoxin